MGSNLAYGAKCSYNFFAIAATQLCNKIKTANETVYMIEATNYFSDCYFHQQRISNM